MADSGDIFHSGHARRNSGRLGRRDAVPRSSIRLRSPPRNGFTVFRRLRAVADIHRNPAGKPPRPRKISPTPIRLPRHRRASRMPIPQPRSERNRRRIWRAMSAIDVSSSCETHPRLVADSAMDTLASLAAVDADRNCRRLATQKAVLIAHCAHLAARRYALPLLRYFSHHRFRGHKQSGD